MNNNITPLNFGATFIKNVEIKKYNPKTNLFTPVNVSIVKYDSSNKCDFKSMETAVRGWKGEIFAKDIIEKAEKMRGSDSDNAHKQIYILTEQNENFDRLKSSKILGMANIQQIFDLKTEQSPKGNKAKVAKILDTKKQNLLITNELEYLQTRPDSVYKCNRRQFKGVGSAILNTIKELYSSIELTAFYMAANFYEKHGFKNIESYKMKYKWKK